MGQAGLGVRWQLTRRSIWLWERQRQCPQRVWSVVEAGDVWALGQPEAADVFRYSFNTLDSERDIEEPGSFLHRTSRELIWSRWLAILQV